jgi:hypothetical protein
MLNKYLFFAAGRVAHPLVECVVSTQQQQQQQQQTTLVAGFVPVLFEAPFPMFPAPLRAPTSGALHATQTLLSPARAGDWSCICGFSNFATRSSCFGCQRPRDPRTVNTATTERGSNTVKPGDWSCACGTHNFARRTNCMTCDAPKPVAAAYPAPVTHGERILPGDWLCSGCTAHNFRSRGTCVRCGEKKPLQAESCAPPVPWTCAACHTANPSSRRDCEICGVTRPNEKHQGSAPLVHVVSDITTPPQGAGPSAPRMGDWTCSQCLYMNFAVRSSCKQCAAGRPSLTGAPAKPAAQEMKKGDWTCTCGYHNFAKRMRCYGCQSQKPIGAGEPAQQNAVAHE